ncbi:MAG: mechanosensitive ion channel [Methyloversatilis sp.]|nr:mechanosensitive ion channel [Methyloversatilis sp.]
MIDNYEGALDWLRRYPPEMHALIGVVLLGLLAWVANWVVKKVLLRLLAHALRMLPVGDGIAGVDAAVARRLSNVVPALILHGGIALVPALPPAAVTVVQNVAGAFMVLTVALALGALLSGLNALYERRPDAHLKPIKGYIQVVKILLYVVAAILMVAALVDRSPLILLSGLGAMAAVLMLVFQDTLLSLVASVQISSNDIVRVGDWVEMPQLNADGDVIDIALHTVKVQNWDKTITTIPTKRFITDPFKNWRGMKEAGGRRIKRSLLLDQQSVRFLSDDERRGLARFALLEDYLGEKQREIDDWNRQLEARGKAAVNHRRVTNIGCFRAYVERMLRAHPGIHRDMTLLVRQLAPTSDGLPLEIYCFTNTTVWAAYEGIQSDIFDHLLAILPEFGLRVSQHPIGVDLREMGRGLAAAQRAELRAAS